MSRDPASTPPGSRGGEAKKKGGNKYTNIFQSCLDANVVGVGSYHIILKDHSKIPTGYYCRIGFISDDDEESFEEKITFQETKRVAWSKALKDKDFAAKADHAEIYEIPEEVLKTVKSSLEENTKKIKLRNFYRKHELKPHIAIYGEMVQAAKCDVKDELDDLDLDTEGGRKLFDTILVQLYKAVEEYVLFATEHLLKNGWSSFTFDLKAENALIYVYTEDDGTEKVKVRLADLDAEEGNSFTDADDEFRDLFGGQKRVLIALAACIVLMVNSIRGIRHVSKDIHDDIVEEKDGHEHKNCSEYRIARFLHNKFLGIKTWCEKQEQETYEKEIQELFEVMTGDRFWRKSTRHMINYINLPRNSAGVENAWSLSTDQPEYQWPQSTDQPEDAVTAEKKEGLNRRRWLLLLMLNIFKCSLCDRPKVWFLEDLVVPLWDRLGINGWEWGINFKLSLDLLKPTDFQKMRVENEGKKPT